MKNFQVFMRSALKCGYISTPLKLIRWWLDDVEKLTRFEAFMVLIAQVNFTDKKFKRDGVWVTCRKGESIKSLETWSKEFRWEEGEIRRFFEEMLEEGVLEVIDHPICEDHIRVANYDKLTGRVKQGRTLFDDFWDIFHGITKKKPIERTRAQKAWDELSEEEQDLAIDNISTYFSNLSDKKHCRTAAGYLENKSFD